MFLCQSYLTLPCITSLNLSCICTAISVINSGFHVSFVILSSLIPDVFLLWMFVSNWWCWDKVTLSYKLKEKYKSIFSCFYVKVILPCLHVPCITGLNLSCICTAISVINFGLHVSSVILSSWIPDVFLLWLFVSNWWCWVKVTEFYK